MTNKIEKITSEKIPGGLKFKGNINDKKFFASYSKKPYFIHVERTDTIKKPLTKEEKEKITKHIKENYL